MNESQVAEMLKTSKYVCGNRQTYKMINNCGADIRCIVIASNVKKELKNKLLFDCTERKIQYYELNMSKRKLGNLAGIDIGCSAVCFMKS